MRSQCEPEQSAITRIRQATAESHQQLESLVESLGMLRNLEGFARHLTLLYRHCASHYPLLAPHPDLQRLVGERQDELLDDLRRLGLQPTAEPCVQSQFTRAQCFGFAYVVEGSRLGALAVSKRLTKLGVPLDGLLSMNHSPAATRQRWVDFCEQLAALPADEWDAAAASASDGFHLLIQAHLDAG